MPRYPGLSLPCVEGEPGNEAKILSVWHTCAGVSYIWQCMSRPSLHRESTDSLIHWHAPCIYTLQPCIYTYMRHTTFSRKWRHATYNSMYMYSCHLSRPLGLFWHFLPNSALHVHICSMYSVGISFRDGGQGRCLPPLKNTNSPSGDYPNCPTFAPPCEFSH